MRNGWNWILFLSLDKIYEHAVSCMQESNQIIYFLSHVSLGKASCLFVW